MSAINPHSTAREITLPQWLQWPQLTLSPFKSLLLLAASFVAAIILLVPVYLIVRSASAGSEVIETIFRWRTLEILGSTLLLAGSVAGGSMLIGVPLAWLTVCTDLPGKRVWAVLAALPLVVPSYVAAFIYVSLLGPKGAGQQLLAPLGVETMPSIYGFWGAFFVLTLISYPFVFLTVRAAFKRLDPALLEAARSLGQSPWQVFRRVTLPVLRPSIAAGSLLVVLYTLRDFGAVTMLQYNTFTRIIYNRYVSYRLDMAAGMALVLVLLTAVILYLEYRSRGRAHYARVSIGAARQPHVVKLGGWKWVAMLFTGSITFWSFLVPAGGLSFWFWRGLNQEWAVQEIGEATSTLSYLLDLVQPAWNSLSVALIGALAAIALALPIAILAVRFPSRLTHFFEQLTYASFALPGIVVALAYVFFGIQYATSLYQTIPLLVVAYVVLFLPQAVGAERASLLQVSSSMEEAGRSLGKRPFHIFRTITLPLVRPGLLAGGALVFLTIMKELPATLLLSPLGFSTLSAQVWANISEAFFARAAAPTLLLLLISSIPLALLTFRDKLDS